MYLLSVRRLPSDGAPAHTNYLRWSSLERVTQRHDGLALVAFRRVPAERHTSFSNRRVEAQSQTADGIRTDREARAIGNFRVEACRLTCDV
jgi:hypothetical protein